MDPREIRVIFNWRRRLHRICVYLFIGCCTLLVAGAVSILAMDDRVDRANIEQNRQRAPRLLRMEEQQQAVMMVCGSVLLALIAVNGILLLIFWRCPNCGKFLASEFSPGFCPRCGVPLEVSGQDGR